MPAESAGIAALVQQHFLWYPLMEIQDVYKLLYQGNLGAEHLVHSVEDYTRSLVYEYDSVQPDPGFRLLEPVRPDGKLFRLNLAALKAQQVGVDALIEPLVETGRLSWGTKSVFRQVWECNMPLYLAGESGFIEGSELEHFTRTMQQLDYPPVHHSDRYRAAYQPSYRLIARKFIRGLGLANAI